MKPLNTGLVTATILSALSSGLSLPKLEQQGLKNLRFEGVLGATVTLYNVIAPLLESVPEASQSNDFLYSVSVVGVGEDGRTTYAQEVILTRAVIGNEYATEAITSGLLQTTTRESIFTWSRSCQTVE